MFALKKRASFIFAEKMPKFDAPKITAADEKAAQLNLCNDMISGIIFRY
jgi:hypothetical protein